MEFHEKLQELRKARDLTQEELAGDLYVSRTAVAKWEQGRGYPSLDSLRDISKYFSVTIDDLLSGDVLLSIAENENKAKLRKTSELLSAAADIFSVLLIILPLYPKTADGFVYSVNLLTYTKTETNFPSVYWVMFISFIILGVMRLFILKICPEKNTRFVSDISIVLNILTLSFLAITRVAYATVLMILILVVKLLLRTKTF